MGCSGGSKVGAHDCEVLGVDACRRFQLDDDPAPDQQIQPMGANLDAIEENRDPDLALVRDLVPLESAQESAVIDRLDESWTECPMHLEPCSDRAASQVVLRKHAPLSAARRAQNADSTAEIVRVRTPEKSWVSFRFCFPVGVRRRRNRSTTLRATRSAPRQMRMAARSIAWRTRDFRTSSKFSMMRSQNSGERSSLAPSILRARS